ncbi:MAG: hypothetical protein CVT66_10030 [Actinobacteria bacterium HGW-Actinobacteria-6]|nr:MAG: hypothetical protein CVT66_10030 [Actinobacteria bacterium HGW-Actinobacteria-6]
MTGRARLLCTLTVAAILCSSAALAFATPIARPDGRPLEETRFLSPTNQYNEWFGDSVAVSDDTMVIGRAASSGTSPSVFVAAAEGDGWGPLVQLPATPGMYGALGRAVAIDGDYIVGGAPNENLAYVWLRTDGVWALQATLSAPGMSYFGKAVDIEGDRIVVGGINGATVFKRTGTTWATEQVLPGSSWSGGSVSLSGDTLAVGNSMDWGTVTIFTRTDTTWTEEETITEIGATDLALEGDVLAVGTGGSVEMFERGEAGWEWTDSVYSEIWNDETNPCFGDRVALSGDRLVVGAYLDNIQDLQNGAAYLFCRTADGWIEDSRWDPPSDDFGNDVAVSGDWVAVGTHGEGTGGAAYAFPIDGEYVVPLWDDGIGGIAAPGVLRNDLGAWLSAELVSDAVHGTVELAEDGSFMYMQDVAYEGADSFTYRVWDGVAYSEPATVQLTAVQASSEIAGTDRFGTAVAVSQEAFPDGADTIVIATGRNWPDALGGSSLAGALGGPILLADTNIIPSVVRAEITRLAPTSAIILGSTSSLGSGVESQLKALGVRTVQRLGGKDRYATAQLVAEETIGVMGPDWEGTVIVATGAGFADALAGSPIAAYTGWPIYLANPRGSAGAFAEKLAETGANEAVVLGGTSSVSSATFNALDSGLWLGATRLWGANRYETSAEIAEFGVSELGMSFDGVGITVGTNFPDGLAGGVLCGLQGSVMLLTDGSRLSPATEDTLWFHADEIYTVTYLGSTASLKPAVRAQVRAALE